MKGNIRALSMLLCITGLVGSIATYKAASIISTYARKVVSVYHFDNRLSSEMHKSLVTFLQSHEANHAQEVLATLKEQFPVVKSAHISYTPGAVEYTVSGYDLLACINNQYGITGEGVVISTNIYAPSYINQISSCFVQDEQMIRIGEQLPQELFRWLCVVPSKLFQTFQVTWCNEHEVQLKNIQNNEIIVRCTAAQLYDDKVLSRYAQIMKDLTERVGMPAITSYIADVRFDKQVVLSKR